MVCRGCWAAILCPPGSGSSGADPPTTLAGCTWWFAGVVGLPGSELLLLPPDPEQGVQLHKQRSVRVRLNLQHRGVTWTGTVFRASVADPWHFGGGSGSGSADPCLWIMDPAASGSFYFHHWPSRCPPTKTIFFFKFSCILLFAGTVLLHHFSKKKSQKEVTKE